MCDRKEDMKAMLVQQGCGSEYDALEKCLDESDRDWRPCQNVLLAFRDCYNALNVKLEVKGEEGTLSSSSASSSSQSSP